MKSRKSRLRSCWIALSAWLAVGGVVSTNANAQVRLWEAVGDDDLDGLGHDVTPVGDFNGDGIEEIAAGAPNDEQNGPFSGTIRVLDGVTGSKLFDIVGALFDQLTMAGRIGDVNGDGLEDLLVSAPGRGNATCRVYSGATHQQRFSIPRKGVIAIAGDVDHDGVNDIAIGYAYGSSATPVDLYSGATGSHLLTLTPPAPASFVFGLSLAGVGDLDGDGWPELLVGDEQEGLPIWNGAATIYSLKTGAIVTRLVGSTAGWLGGSVGALRDLDGDGTGDFFVGAAGELPTGSNGVGVIHIYSGRTQIEIDRFEAPGSEWFRDAKAIGDLDGDGVDDLAIGVDNLVPSGNWVRVTWLYSFQSHRRLRGLVSGDYSILHFATVADRDGDGDDEIVWADVFAPSHNGSPDDGLVVLERSGPVWLTAYPKLLVRNRGSPYGSVGSPPPGPGGGGGSRGTRDYSTNFHLAGFQPGTTVSLYIVAQNGIPTSRLVGKGPVRLDGTTDMGFALIWGFPGVSIDFAAVGTDAHGAPVTSGTERVEWR